MAQESAIPSDPTREMLDLLRPALGTTSTVSLETELYVASADELLERIRAVTEASAR